MSCESEKWGARERDTGGRAPGGDARYPADTEGRLDGIDEVLEIEALLRRMPLRRPGAALDARVLSTCRNPAARAPVARAPVARSRLRWAAAAAVVAAAGAAPVVTHLLTRGDGPGNTAVTTRDPPAPGRHVGRAEGGGPAPEPPPSSVPPTPVAPTPQRPVRIERTLAGGFSSDGVVGVAGDAPLHRYRRRSVRQVWIVDPATGKRLAVTLPRDEVVLVRVEPF